MRARTSSLRFVSWVEVVSIASRPVAARRRRMRVWNSCDRACRSVPGSPPTSFSETSGLVAVEGGVLHALGHDRRRSPAGSARRTRPRASPRIRRAASSSPMKSSSSASRSGRRCRAPSPRRRPRAPGPSAVDGAARPADVGPVDGEGGDHLAQRVAQLPPGVVAVAAVAVADVGRAGRSGARPRRPSSSRMTWPLAGVDHLVVARRSPGEGGVGARAAASRPPGRRRGRRPGQEVVACGARHRPGGGQLLVRPRGSSPRRPTRPGAASRSRQQVAGRVPQPVDVVDPQPVERPRADQLEDQGVGVGEDRVVLHPQPGQRRRCRRSAGSRAPRPAVRQ